MLGSGVEFYLILVIFAIPGIALGFTVHEYCHAAVANAYGDPTPRRQGRLSLNPANQIDPFGLVMLLVIGFGFARPVMYNPAYVRRGHQRALLSAAGPLSNLVMAAVIGLLLRGLTAADPGLSTCIVPSFNLPALGYVYWFLVEAFYVNVILCLFNLIPIPPLDGFGVAEGLLGGRLPGLFRWLEMQRNGLFIALIILVLVVPTLLGGFNPLYQGIRDVFNTLWLQVVSGPPPAIYFPNVLYALIPGGQSLASALGTPCLAG
ncbi:MAG: site-2 protease family protein [Candidatus Dormibacteria bacterium]